MSARIYKTLIVGARGVGKTALVRQYLYGSFSASYTATIGVDMNVYTLDFPDGRIIVTVLDLAGQQTFAALKNRFYWDVHHIIGVFDVNNLQSFRALPDWYNSLSEGLCIPGEIALTGCIVANKFDSTLNTKVDLEEAKLLAGFFSWDYYETSAKTSMNVSELFVHAAISCRMQRPRTTYIESMDLVST